MDKDELARLIGNNVRYNRMKRKMTQNELAQIVGINASAITRIEGGTRMMSVQVLRDVANALSISTDAPLFDPSAPTHLQNIFMLLRGQTDESLAHIEHLLQVLVEEYGEIQDNYSEI